MDLPFNKHGIYCLANVMGGNKFKRFYCAKLYVHRDNRKMGGIAELCIGMALPILVQWLGGRIISALCAKHKALFVLRQLIKEKRVCSAVVFAKDTHTIKCQICLKGNIQALRDLSPQLLCAEPRGISRHKGLTRRRGFPGIWRHIRICSDAVNFIHGYTQHGCKNLRNNRVCALSDVHRPLIKANTTI